MDIMSHVVYGATVCSRSGIAGGRQGYVTKGQRHAWYRDWTVWCAAFFGILPDMVGMGAPFLLFCLPGFQGHFFRDFAGPDITTYRYMHSLVTASCVTAMLFFVSRRVAICSLAWQVHVIMDAFTHSAGKFQTTVFYPLTTWGIRGIPYWRHIEVVIFYWIMVPVIWTLIVVLRRKQRLTEQEEEPLIDSNKRQS